MCSILNCVFVLVQMLCGDHVEVCSLLETVLMFLKAVHRRVYSPLLPAGGEYGGVSWSPPLCLLRL